MNRRQAGSDRSGRLLIVLDRERARVFDGYDQILVYISIPSASGGSGQVQLLGMIYV